MSEDLNYVIEELEGGFLVIIDGNELCKCAISSEQIRREGESAIKEDRRAQIGSLINIIFDELKDRGLLCQEQQRPTVEFPRVEGVSLPLLEIQRYAKEDNEEIEIRLQVYDDGDWSIHSGSSDYDQDHRGFWGSGSIDADTDCEALALDLIEQCKDQAVQEGYNIEGE